MTLPLGTIVQGDALDILRTFPDRSVQAIVTSPPYWALRDYSEAGQYGLEPTPEAHVAVMVAVFREARRVLRDDGMCWLNYGDCYANNGAEKRDGGHLGGGTRKLRPAKGALLAPRLNYGLKPKDLVGMPWRIAFALQAGFAQCSVCRLELRADLWPVWNGHRVCMDCALAGRRESKIRQTEEGWYLRADCIWAKSNPMPESVTDRPAKSHEYVFLLSKRARYFYDAEAVREITGNEADPKEYANADGRRHFHENDQTRGMMQSNPAFKSMTNPSGRNLRTVWAPKGNPQEWARDALTYLLAEGYSPEDILQCLGIDSVSGLSTVWQIPTQSYPGAHFATFPEALAERCILSATSEKGACPACGAPWGRVVGVEYEPAGGRGHEKYSAGMADGSHGGPQSMKYGRANKITTTEGWRPTCDCPAAEPIPCIVLDPFAGSGTTGLVAYRLGREFVGIDLAGGDKDLGGHTAHDRLRAGKLGRPWKEQVAHDDAGQGELLAGVE